MIYTCTQDIIDDLEKYHDLVRIPHEVDPNLEMAEIHRRVYQADGPAIFFERVKGSPFPAASNLIWHPGPGKIYFQTHVKPAVQRLMEIVADPAVFLKSPHNYLSLPITLWRMLPKKVVSGPVFEHTTTLDRLPQIRCWPEDGGAFVLLPQVYSEDPAHPGIMRSNLGMYRIQLSGNQYVANREAGLHYQIRRDIGIHHATALKLNQPLRVSTAVSVRPGRGAVVLGKDGFFYRDDLVEDVLGQVDEGGTGQPRRRLPESDADIFRDTPCFVHRRAPLRDGADEFDVVHLVECLQIEIGKTALTGEDDDGGRAVKTVRYARHGIQDAGAGRYHGRGGLPRRPGIPLGHQDGGLLVAHVDEADARIHEGFVHAELGHAAKGKDDRDTFLLQGPDNELAARECRVFFHGCPPRGLISRVERGARGVKNCLTEQS